MKESRKEHKGTEENMREHKRTKGREEGKRQQ